MLEITDLSVFENYESNNKKTTGALLVSVSGIDFKDVYILLADKKTGYVKYLCRSIVKFVILILCI